MAQNKKQLAIKSQLRSDYRWLLNNNLYHDDIVVDQLADPKLEINGQKYISFCSNNYLGLSKRKQVLQQAKAALLKYGIGTCESRRLGGDLRLLEQLEDKISEFKETEDTVIFATGLLANVGIISSIVDSNLYLNRFYSKKLGDSTSSLIIGDQINHRSIQMGIKLSNAESIKYKHNDMDDLEKILEYNKRRRILIITDGVFSMDGDLAPLNRIAELAEYYDAAVLVDDAHGTGVLGSSGKGTAEHFDVKDKIDFHMGTLSKAFGGLGGFVSAKKEFINMIKMTCSTYYFTSSLPADQAAGLIAAISIAQKEDKLRKKLWKNVVYLTKGLLNLGLEFPLRISHIVPILIRDEKKAIQLEKYLFERRILCSSVTVPAVAKGKERIRCTVNATHSLKEIDHLLNVLNDASKEFKLKKFEYNKEDYDNLINSCPEYIKGML